jgi:hypothetical protein
MEADYISGLQPASEIWHPISNNEGYQLEANFIDYISTLIYCKRKEKDTFSTTMRYRASECKFNFPSSFRSPVIACPEGPRMEQSMRSSSGS